MACTALLPPLHSFESFESVLRSPRSSLLSCCQPCSPQAEEAEGWAECLAWLAECGAVVTDADQPADAALDCKASTGQLKMPEEKEKVAHGDENLRVEDFLKGFAP